MFFIRRTKSLQESIPQIVYGGVDGTISTFAVVAGAFGGGLEVSSIFILGVASLVADGFSMAVGSFFAAESSKSKHPKAIGLRTFLSFVLLGSILLLPYLFSVLGLDASSGSLFTAALVLAVLTFAFIGALKSHVEGSTKIRGAFEVVVLGVIAAIIAYALGDFLEKLIS